MIINRIKLKKFLISYLFSTGVLGHMIIISGILLIPLYFQEPVNFFFERITNTLAHFSHGKKQQVGHLLLKTKLINDWKTPAIEPFVILQPISQWTGQGASPNQNSLLTHKNAIYVHSSKELLSAIKKPQPGATIIIMPGTYSFNGRSLSINQPGKATAPITVKSSLLGSVKLKFNLLEGFHVKAPHWIFENLDIQGTCSHDSYCEHAFHVVGKAKYFVLKNNIIHDFNAAIKVNGVNISGQAQFPDNGVIEKNTFYNKHHRQTANPVTLLNINSVNNWRVRGNLISDFSKAKGDHTSYGTFMKGNGKNGIFENNLIICERNLPPNEGIRIGLSFGGGGTGKSYCRNQDCSTEFSNGIIRNNIIMHCSHDVGIYLNKAKNTQIYNNLIFNTLGIDVRYSTSSATIHNNIISGRIKNRNEASHFASHNIIDYNCLSSSRDFSDCSFFSWFRDLNAADLILVNGEEILAQGKKIKSLTTDFCTNKRSENIDIGPIQYSNNQLCTPNNMEIKVSKPKPQSADSSGY